MNRFEKDFEKYLNLYLDDRLDESEAAEFEKYLAENPEKAAEHEAYKTLNFTAKGELLPDLPEGYWQGLESRIKSRVAGLPESRGFWARFAEKYFSFNRTIKVAATALTIATVILISRHFVLSTKVTDMAESAKPMLMPSTEIRGGRSGEVQYHVMGESAQALAADTMRDRILEEEIDDEEQESKDQGLYKSTMTVGDLADKVEIPPPAEEEESIPAPIIQPETATPQSESYQPAQRLELAEPKIELRSAAEGLASESLKQVPDTVKAMKQEYNVATAGKEPMGEQRKGPEREAFVDSLNKYKEKEKSVKFDTLNPEADSDFIQEGQAVTTKPPVKESLNVEAHRDMLTENTLQLNDFPYIPETEYSFTEPSDEENISGYFDMSLKQYAADSLLERQNLLRLEGDSLIQAYNIAVDPIKKLNLFQQIINKYLVIIQDSKSEPDAEKCQNLLKLGFQNNIILYPEYNNISDSVKTLIRNKE
jgi:hypothetical protein